MSATTPDGPHGIGSLPRPGARRFDFTPEHAVPWLACLWLGVVLMFRWPALWEPSIVSDSPLDAAFFGYAGQLVRQGGTPYLTFWDHKAPLIFYLDAAALVVSGGRVWGLWLLNLGVLIAATLLGHGAMKRAFGPVGAMLGTACFAGSVAVLLPVNMTEGYVLPLQWAVCALFVRWQAEQRAPLAFGAGVGLLGALAFFLRANLIGAALSVGLVTVVVLAVQRGWRETLLFVAGGLGAAALVVLVVVASMAQAGALAAFWDQAFHYNFVYAASGLRSKLGALYFGAGMVTHFTSVAIPLAGWLLCARRVWAGRRRLEVPPVYLLALVWLPVELLLGSTSGRHYGHYFATCFAPLALLAAAFVAEVSAVAPTLFSKANGLLVFRLLAACTAFWAVASAALNMVKDKDEQERRAQASQTAAYVRASTPPDARLLVWGHAVEVHFFSDRRPASRFVYPLALLTPNYADAALVQGFLDEIKASNPPLIIDATPKATDGEDLVPSLATWNPDWKYPKDAKPGQLWWSMTPQMRTFYDYVHANYSAVDTIGPKQWVVYRRNGVEAPTSAAAPGPASSSR